MNGVSNDKACLLQYQVVFQLSLFKDPRPILYTNQSILSIFSPQQDCNPTRTVREPHQSEPLRPESDTSIVAHPINPKYPSGHRQSVLRVIAFHVVRATAYFNYRIRISVHDYCVVIRHDLVFVRIHLVHICFPCLSRVSAAVFSFMYAGPFEELAVSQKEGDTLRGDLLANQKALSDLNVYADSLRSR